jgi:hypothetical protein
LKDEGVTTWVKPSLVAEFPEWTSKGELAQHIRSLSQMVGHWKLHFVTDRLQRILPVRHVLDVWALPIESEFPLLVG